MKVHKAQPTGGTRRARGERVSASLSEINVVPLVDVMLVMLIIFMVTAPMMQRGIDVNLPVARRAQQISAERVFVTVPLSYRTDGLIQLGEDSIDVGVLAERVRQMLATQQNNEVFLRGDGAISLQELLVVMDELKAGGVERVGIVAQLPTER